MRDLKKEINKIINGWKHGTGIHIISSSRWVGNYGYVGRVWIDQFAIYNNRDLRIVANALKCKRKIKKNKDGDIFILVDGVKMLTPELVLLGNGQIYDVENYYWFTVKDSKLLKKEITRGYKYNTPQGFFKDC